jgi:hypothetical protein
MFSDGGRVGPFFVTAILRGLGLAEMLTRGVAFDNVRCESYIVFGSPQASPTFGIQ